MLYFPLLCFAFLTLLYFIGNPQMISSCDFTLLYFTFLILLYFKKTSSPKVVSEFFNAALKSTSLHDPSLPGEPIHDVGDVVIIVVT